MPEQKRKPRNLNTSNKINIKEASGFTADELNSFLKEYRGNARRLAVKLKFEAYVILCLIISVGIVGLVLFIYPPISATRVDILRGKTIDSLTKVTSPKYAEDSIIVVRNYKKVPSDTIIIKHKK